MSYSPPTAKNGVYFTRNLTSANYTRGLTYLRYYYDNSMLAKAPYYPITNFQGMIDYLKNNYPTYIESLGELADTVDDKKIIAAMKEAAARNLVDYPRPAYFSQALINNTNYTLTAKIGDALGAVGEGLFDFGKIIWILSIIGVGAFVYIEFGPQIKELLKKAKAV